MQQPHWPVMEYGYIRSTELTGPQPPQRPVPVLSQLTDYSGATSMLTRDARWRHRISRKFTAVAALRETILPNLGKSQRNRGPRLEDGSFFDVSTRLPRSRVPHVSGPLRSFNPFIFSCTCTTLRASGGPLPASILRYPVQTRTGRASADTTSPAPTPWLVSRLPAVRSRNCAG